MTTSSTENGRRCVARWAFLLAPALAVACLLVATSAPAEALPPEKGPRCSDGIDNDGDGKIDGEDPDCGGDATNDGGSTGDTGPFPAALLLLDGTGDRVTSDGLGSYVDGLDEHLSSEVDGGSEYDLTLGKRRQQSNRAVRYDFSAMVQAGACAGSDCSCSTLPGNTIVSKSGYLRINLEPNSALCDLAEGGSGTGRITALIGSCRVTWNPEAPGAPAVLDGVTVTRTGPGSWTVSTYGTGRAWLWSEGKRNVRVDEGVFDIPFNGAKIDLVSGGC